MNNIYLCGFMGSGKSSVGRLLAKRISKIFVDTDKEIIKMEGKIIQDIFNQKGEDEFRRLEEEISKSLAKREGLVVSTGGGFFNNPKNIERALEGNKIVFLDLPFEECYRRIKNSRRPLVLVKTKNELRKIYEKRSPQYRRFANIIVSSNFSINNVVNLIIQSLD